MHFYRPLHRLAAITFDLDDTLYDNRLVIKQTEQQSVALFAALPSWIESLSVGQSADFYRLRQELREQDPEIYHDVTQWRWRAVHLALSRQGFYETRKHPSVQMRPCRTLPCGVAVSMYRKPLMRYYRRWGNAIR